MSARLENNLVYCKAKQYAVSIISLCRYLRETHREFSLADQLLRSSTSIGANIAEATQGQSIKDFLAKLYISLKEAFESSYWLDVLHESQLITTEQYTKHDKDCEELIKLLTSITKTTEAKLKITD